MNATAAADPTPTASATSTTTTMTTTTRPDGQRPPDSEIGPGIVGFVATFAIAVALVLLVRDMNRRVQRLRYRGEASHQEPEGDQRRDA